jgi:hypothetical protein
MSHAWKRSPASSEVGDETRGAHPSFHAALVKAGCPVIALLRTDRGPENGSAKTPPHLRTKSLSLSPPGRLPVGRLHANVSANDKPSVFFNI